ncbi:hypothetical protein [Frigoriglobus tundricola]|uniref:Uncharacterized protein n=1 Tax=Frigoriglobus tundricola TaxID=2774151 RepID=A0A6M5Z5C1_9BACT|nr:hypothetical protein [Frigoriglobus tundricola]QJX01286.1 hypothetical protein FTUN_8928 [Frigoriglobus tundricola]
MPLTQKRASRSGGTERDVRLREVLALHLHPRHGSAYWLRRQADLGWDVRDRVRTVADLARLGRMPVDALRRCPVRDFIPAAFHNVLSRFVTGETAGTSGQPCATAYRDDEFEAAFVTPFLRVAEATGFPSGVPWLWVGPSGPHIIGKVVRELARRTGSIDPFSVDFDPRWAKKLAAGSLARQRYLDHVTAQAIDTVRREDIGVLFTTPPALTALAEQMTARAREAIRGIHYGGMSLAPGAVNGFREAFPNAVHLAGYGNTLFGVVMEGADGHRLAMDYFPLGDRVLFDVVRDPDTWPPAPVPVGTRGRVMFHRLDESALLVNVVERDEAERIAPSAPARALGGTDDGLRDPAPPAALNAQLQHGLY